MDPVDRDVTLVKTNVMRARTAGRKASPSVVTEQNASHEPAEHALDPVKDSDE